MLDSPNYNLGVYCFLSRSFRSLIVGSYKTLRDVNEASASYHWLGYIQPVMRSKMSPFMHSP